MTDHCECLGCSCDCCPHTEGWLLLFRLICFLSFCGFKGQSAVGDDDDDDDDDVGLPTADSAGRISRDFSPSPASTPCSPRPDSPHSSSSSSSRDFDVVL